METESENKSQSNPEKSIDDEYRNNDYNNNVKELLQSPRHQIKINDWNESNEHLLQHWGKIANCYSIIHDRSSKYCKTLHQILGLPCKIILGVASSIEFAKISSSENPKTVSFLIGFLALIGLIISLTQDFMSFESRSNKHYMTSISYQKVVLDISIEFTKPSEKRVNVNTFLKNIKNFLTEIKKTSPEIPSHIYNKYNEEANNILDYPADLVIHKFLDDEKENVEQLDKVINKKKDIKDTRDSNQDNTPNKPNTPNPNLGNEDFSDVQDEFTKEMQKKIEASQKKIEEYQFNRFISYRS